MFLPEEVRRFRSAGSRPNGIKLPVASFPPFTFMAFPSRVRALLQEESSSQQLGDEILSTSDSKKTPPSQRYAQIAQGVRSSLPSTCRWLAPGDIDLVNKHPTTAGEFANIWEAVHDDRKVILKSYRCCVLSGVTQVIEVHRNI